MDDNLEQLLIEQNDYNESLQLYIFALKNKIDILEKLNKTKTEIIKSYKSVIDSMKIEMNKLESNQSDRDN
jgi:adenylate cyclase